MMDTVTDMNLMYVLAFANALILFATAAILRGVPVRRSGDGAQAEAAAAERLMDRIEGIDRRLESLESLIRAKAEAPQGRESAQTGLSRYGEALRLVGGGAAPGDLVARCGLSRGEADLIVRLHGTRHRGGADVLRVASCGD